MRGRRVTAESPQQVTVSTGARCRGPRGPGGAQPGVWAASVSGLRSADWARRPGPLTRRGGLCSGGAASPPPELGTVGVGTAAPAPGPEGCCGEPPSLGFRSFAPFRNRTFSLREEARLRGRRAAESPPLRAPPVRGVRRPARPAVGTVRADACPRRAVRSVPGSRFLDEVW